MQLMWGSQRPWKGVFERNQKDMGATTNQYWCKRQGRENTGGRSSMKNLDPGWTIH